MKKIFDAEEMIEYFELFEAYDFPELIRLVSLPYVFIRIMLTTNY